MSTGMRGEGLVYVGSLAEFRGRTIRWIDECGCRECSLLQPWERRFKIRLESGETLHHARETSVEDPSPEPCCIAAVTSGGSSHEPDCPNS